MTLKNGKKLHVKTTGSGPAIVFMHGLGSNLDYWGAVIDYSQVEKSHQVIKYDWDGSGLSPLNQKELSIESLVEDLISLLDTLKIEKAILVGHSISGVWLLKLV